MAEVLVFGVVSVLAAVLGFLWAQRYLPSSWLLVFAAGLVLRIIGSTARLEVMERVYSGVGDARMYFDYGRMYAEQLRDFDFTFLADEASPTSHWWGSQFVRFVTALVVLFTGENLRAAFLVFSLFGFIGLVLCVLAVAEVDKDRAFSQARWVWLLPSLWFWPSSVGKEAIMLLAAGLAVYGYVGRAGRPRWWICGLAVALAGAVRPHVAVVIVMSLLFGELVRPGKGWSARRIAGVAVALVVVAFSMQAGLSMLGLEDADLDGIQEEFEYRSGQTAQGGSKIEVSSGWSAIPMALVTILMRPFPWEARGVGLISAAEIGLIWMLIFVRWSSTRQILRAWRNDPYLRFGLPFLTAIALMYGLAFANLGIIARQRAVLLPFLLTFVVPALRDRSSPQPELAPQGRPA